MLQLEPLTAFLRHLVAAGTLHTPSLPDGTPASPVSHHADDTTLLVSDVDVDGPVAKQAVLRFCQASNARENESKAKGITLGTHRPITGVHVPTQAVFTEATAEPPRHLGIPIGVTSKKAAEACYTARIPRMKGLAAAWRRHNLSMVGRVHVAKQVLGNALAYHFTFVRPTPPQMAALRQAVNGYVAWSLLPEDASLAAHGRAVLLPEEHIACLDKASGGIGHIHLEAFQQALQAKAITQLALPGNQPWKVLHRALLHHFKPADSPGWGWDFGTAGMPTQLPDRLADMVAAFRATHPQPLPHAKGTDPRVLLHEPLYHNNSLHSPATGQPFSPPAPLPQDWPLTVGQLRAAPPAIQQQADIQLIAGAAPDGWKALCPEGLLAPQLPDLPTWRLSPDGAWVVDTAGQVSAVQTTGRLSKASGAHNTPAPTSQWQPVCLIDCRKPRLFWTPQERLTYELAPVAEKAKYWPLEKQLLGRWEELQCFPVTHGHGSMSLVHYTVSHTRTLSTQLAVEGKLRPDAIPIQPAAWRTVSIQQGAAASTTSVLQQWEAKWKEDCRRSSSARFSQLPPELPSWLTATTTQPTNRQAGPQASPHTSQSTQPAPQGPGPSQRGATGAAAGTQQVWHRLWDCLATNRAKVLGWRLQHARLVCGLYLASKVQRGRDGRQFCPHPGCQEQRPKQLNSLTHTFLHCPVYSAARHWLQQLWGVITGGPGPPVDSMELMLGDRPQAWQQYPQSLSSIALWQTLRLTFLHALWVVHSAAPAHTPTSAGVVSHAVLELQRLMRNQFRMAALSEDTLNNLPLQLITAQLKETQLDLFKAVWATGNVLCSVATDPGGRVKLVVHLSMQHPVAAPGQVLPQT